MNYFTIFDAQSGVSFLPNWVVVFMLMISIPPAFWFDKCSRHTMMSIITRKFNIELKLLLGPLPAPGTAFVIISLYVLLSYANTRGLYPYVFTASAHLTFTMTFALLIWVSLNVASSLKDFPSMLVHLLPLGTPYLLMPFMVMIELVSNLIRPITLAVRLAANMSAGHLLLTLAASMDPSASIFIALFMAISLTAILILEIAVAFIQARVFASLSMLYVAEVNTSKLNV